MSNAKKIDAQILRNKPCFEIHKTCNLTCEKKTCRNWMSSEENLNCAILSSRDGCKTLQEIGGFFDITRMRVCQIEHTIKKKIKDKLEDL